MTEPAIAAHDIAAGKGRDNVFSALSFSVPPASFTALVGPNGSGKTTLFEVMLGLIAPRAGAVDVLGGPPARARKAVAYVPQMHRLAHDGGFIGRDFVAAAYQGQRWGITLRPRAAARAVDRALAQVGAEDLARCRLAALSGGQRQRLLIAQALVNAPRLIFMDEPLAQLDPAAQDRIVALAAHLRDAHGISVLFSTHDVNPVAEIADRVLYLAGGGGRIGGVETILTDDVLSALYGVPMHVVRTHGQIVVMRDRASGRAGAAAAGLVSWPAPLDMAFMRHAFAAATCIAVAGSAVGYFVVLRRQAFASHALSNLGFAGAAGASLIGADPMLGLFVFVLAAALLMAASGEDLGERDISVDMILMFSLGLGILFVNRYSANANAAIGILFGSVLGISAGQLRLTAIVLLGVVLLLAVLFRPLRFASLNPQAARARGLPIAFINILFLLVLAGTAAVAVPVIGALLSFAIFVGPAAAAQAWTGRVASGLALTVALALAQTWAGLTLSYYVNVPATSCIAGLSFFCYALAGLTATHRVRPGFEAFTARLGGRGPRRCRPPPD
ncbi:metal ABC transporter permease [Salinisphaera sp.]|uniref:metal ABC transporter permease n=1 Tax=Salinisphaera sp. TaxID=1914330 RepID=UPI002D781D76|nr:metal ABC transporter permease [Salinisphaera sp.]HET7315089.1 metal ABC transporter permease [Salinisphaera sp.]